MFNKTILSLIIVLLILVVNVQAFNYEITYYANSTRGTSLTSTPVSFHSAEADSIVLNQNLYFTFNTSIPPDTYTSNWESPFSTLIAI